MILQGFRGNGGFGRRSLFLLLVAVACSSATSSVSPGVTVKQMSNVASIKMSVASGLPVDYQLEITNPLQIPVTLTSIELETVGESGAYSMKRVRHAFSLIIQPQSSAVVPIRAWVHTLQETDSGSVAAPANVRGVASFASEAGVLKTAFTTRVQ